MVGEYWQIDNHWPMFYHLPTLTLIHSIGAYFYNLFLDRVLKLSGPVTLQLVPPKIGPLGPFMAATAGPPGPFAALQMVPPGQLWRRGWSLLPQPVPRVYYFLLNHSNVKN